MNLPVLWTPVALQSLSEVLDYTFNTFGGNQLVKLSEQIDATVERIAAFPFAGKEETDLTNQTGVKYHSFAVIKEIKLIYTISTEAVYVEYVKNNRQDDATILVKILS